jgi:hypothetical protein
MSSAIQLISVYCICCIHRRNCSNQTYLGCCPIRAWIQLLCLEGVRAWWWLWSVTFTEFSWQSLLIISSYTQEKETNYAPLLLPDSPVELGTSCPRDCLVESDCVMQRKVSRKSKNVLNCIRNILSLCIGISSVPWYLVLYAFMFQYNGLLMTYTGCQKQLLDNKHLLTVSCVKLGTSLYIAVLHQRGCFIQRHILMSWCKHLVPLWCWNTQNSNLELGLLGRSELTVQCINAFKRVLPIPRSTKYSPFFSLQLQFLCLCYHTFQCCDVKANHST